MQLVWSTGSQTRCQVPPKGHKINLKGHEMISETINQNLAKAKQFSVTLDSGDFLSQDYNDSHTCTVS